MDGASVLEQQARLRRKQALDDHRKHFDEIIQHSMATIQDALEAAAASVLKDLSMGRDMALEMMMAVFAHDLQRRLDRLAHKSVDAQWAKHDANHDGVLDKMEMRGLVKEILADMQAHMPRLAQESIQPAIESLRGWIEHDSTGPMGMEKGMSGVHVAMELSVQTRVEAAATKMSDLFLQLLRGLLKCSDEISDEIFKEIDTDGNNEVSKHEFYEGFGEAMSSVLDFSRIVQQVIQARAAQNKKNKKKGIPAPQGMTSLQRIGEDSLGSTLLQIGFGVLVVGMVYTIFTRQRSPHRG